MGTYNYSVVIEAAGEGGYVASCPALEGCYSEGETYDEALANISEAVSVYIESLKMDGEPIPKDVEVSVKSVRVAA
jgi:predicted RNase H-like HicB family nuclease